MEKAVEEALKRDKHVAVKSSWVEQCLSFLGTRQNKNMPTPATALNYTWEQLLVADLRSVGLASLPANLAAALKQTLPGPYLLQLNEISNIYEPMERRYDEVNGPRRMLKLALTDGVQDVAAVEIEHCPALRLNVHAGCKVELSNFQIRRGMILLTPRNIKVLGGHVEQLVTISNNMRREVKRGVLPKEWMEELKETAVVGEPVAANLEILTQQSGAPASAPMSQINNYSPQNAASLQTTQRQPPPSFQNKPPLPSTPYRQPVTNATLDLTDSPNPRSLSNGASSSYTISNSSFINLDDNDADFDADLFAELDEQLKSIEQSKPPGPPNPSWSSTPSNTNSSSNYMPPPNNIPPPKPSRSISKQILLEEEDEDILAMLDDDLDSIERTPRSKPPPSAIPNIPIVAPRPPPKPPNTALGLSETVPPSVPIASALFDPAEIYKNFNRPPALARPVPSQKEHIPIRANSIDSLSPPHSQKEFKATATTAPEYDDDGDFMSTDFSRVTPRSNKRRKKFALESTPKRPRVELVPIPEASAPSDIINRVPGTPPNIYDGAFDNIDEMDSEAMSMVPPKNDESKSKVVEILSFDEIVDTDSTHPGIVPAPLKAHPSITVHSGNMRPPPISIEDSPKQAPPKGGTIESFFTSKSLSSLSTQLKKSSDPDLSTSPLLAIKSRPLMTQRSAPDPGLSAPPNPTHSKTVLDISDQPDDVPLINSATIPPPTSLSTESEPVPVKSSLFDDDRDFEPQEPPLVYINGGGRFKPSIVRVKGFLSGVVRDTFSTRDNAYSLLVKLNDGSGVVPVRFAHEMLLPLLSISVDVYQQRQTTPAGTNMLKKLYEGLVKKLQKMKGIFYIEKWNSSDPVVVKFVSDVGLGQEVGWELLHRLED